MTSSSLTQVSLPGYDAGGARRATPWRRGRSLTLNIGLFLLLFQLYKIVRRTFAQRNEALGFAHAYDLLALEERLRLDVELGIQRWALEHEWITRSLNWHYAAFMWLFYGCCAVAILLAPERFPFLRRVFLWSMALALPWYAIYPLAPPRFMTDYGFVDTLARFGPNYFSDEGLVTANRFAAMPSMHIGWTTVGALMLAAAIPNWRRIPVGPLLGVVHVGLMVLTVIATGNHYVLDVLGGWLVVLAAIGLARLPSPRRLALRRTLTPGYSPSGSASPSTSASSSVSIHSGTRKSSSTAI